MSTTTHPMCRQVQVQLEICFRVISQRLLTLLMLLHPSALIDLGCSQLRNTLGPDHHLKLRHLDLNKYLLQSQRARALRHIGLAQKFGRSVRNKCRHVLRQRPREFDPRASPRSESHHHGCHHRYSSRPPPSCAYLPTGFPHSSRNERGLEANSHKLSAFSGGARPYLRLPFYLQTICM